MNSTKLICKEPLIESQNECVLTNLDALVFLDSLPADSIDLIVTDPPYESIEKHRTRGTNARLGGGKRSTRPWFDVFPNERFPELFKAMFAVLKNNRHCYFFCDFETMFFVVPVARAAGFTVHKPLVWNKLTIGMGYHYRAQYEFVLFMSRGKRPLNDRSVPDVLSARRVYGKGAAEKPFSLVDVFVRQSTRPGQLVCDPFVGSGVVGEAALAHQCRFLGNDIDSGAVERTRNRLSQKSFSLTLNE